MSSSVVARVVVDSPLPHLDRLFDYAVPLLMREEAVTGCRVHVRFAGRKLTGFIVEITDHSEHGGTLAPLLKVVSPESVLTPDIALLARSVADRWAGTMADVLHLAIPPRHAAAEAKPRREEVAPPGDVGADSWLGYRRGTAFVQALSAGGSPRAALAALPHHDPARAVAEAVAATLCSGRGSLVCVPDARDLTHWQAVFTEVLGSDQFVVLNAAEAKAARYRSFLALARGEVHVALGTRATAYAPVANLGLVAMWDDGDDSYREPRSPYAHAREVVLLRAVQSGAGALIAGYARTPEVESLVEQGWLAEVDGDLAARRREWPTVTVTDGSETGAAPVRLPHQVFEAIRDAVGPVLIQVPRRGYRSALRCQTCRTPASCAHCQGPLIQPSASSPIVCRWCGVAASPWRCGTCQGTTFRAPVVGTLRTAEEFAAAFADRTIITSSGSSIVDRIAEERALVLATPGAEPVAERGYDAVVLLDTWLMTARDDVRVTEEAHRRWFNALALAGHHARAVVVGETSSLQALVRADPVSVAQRELEHRADIHLPPIGRLAIADGSPADLSALAALFESIPAVEVLGPVGLDEHHERLVLRTPRRHGAQMAAVLKSFAAERSAAKLPVVRVQVDPATF